MYRKLSNVNRERVLIGEGGIHLVTMMRLVAGSRKPGAGSQSVEHGVVCCEERREGKLRRAAPGKGATHIRTRGETKAERPECDYGKGGPG